MSADNARLLSLRRAVLRYLYERQGLALTASHITHSLNQDGTDYTPEEVTDSLRLLEGLEYVATTHDPLGPGIKRHQITAAGILFAESGK